ncbi:MAG: asparagine synthetase B [Candidatus Marinimicrobia bacterium]|nr:asparagine synthetase B [Candidatus Neomarinimicrobiota bacterium]MDP6610961.1 asparagine synthetase B [Candidatus Neomarinimicrobiota bacterium]
MKRFILSVLVSIQVIYGQKILIPMDQAQKDHLKAYGTAFWILNEDINVEWILNYRGGSFMTDSYPDIEQECRVRGVSYEVIGAEQTLAIYNEVEINNMDVVLLEKAPKIAIYTPPNKQPWDDAVTLALTYAEVPYTTLWDEEVFNGALGQYDWLHLHHEDFTGQYGKFYRNYHTAAWYISQQEQFEGLAKRLGFSSVHAQKKALAQMIKNYVTNGGFLFAMCSATDSFDIALAAQKVDVAHSVFDGTPIENNVPEKMDYNNALAFSNFQIIPDPMVYEYSDIDYPPSDNPVVRGAEADYFTLFEFSAKYDPVPTMLTQNHVPVVKGFMGQTTGFNREKIKKHVLVMGEDPTTPQVKYLHGNHGQGTFTFLGGHDPEDYQHFVGDPQTDLSLHRNSPGYRLILNNILFPAARKKERKT